MDNIEKLINDIYEKEPDSIITVTESKEPIMIMDKEDWNKLADNSHLKEKMRKLKAPMFVGRLDIPIIGTAIYIELEDCEVI
jgi:hypothetical protein